MALRVSVTRPCDLRTFHRLETNFDGFRETENIPQR